MSVALAVVVKSARTFPLPPVTVPPVAVNAMIFRVLDPMKGVRLEPWRKVEADPMTPLKGP